MSVALPIVEEVDIRPDSITGPRDIRAVRTLRISVTDRCNFRCVYCMPEDKIDWVTAGHCNAVTSHRTQSLHARCLPAL